MYKKRTPANQKPKTEPYTVFNPHTIDLNQRNWNVPFLYCVSIDPGRVNFAIRVERRHPTNPQPIIPELFQKIDFQDSKDTDPVEWHLFGKITRFLDQYRDLFLKSHVVVVERQLQENYKAVRVSQHVLTYFMMLLKNQPPLALIMEVDPKLKGKILGAPPKCDIKTWAVEKAYEILTLRSDSYSLRILEENKKQDDLSDTIVQLEGIFKKLGWKTTFDLYVA